MSRLRDQDGFTLMEVLMAITVGFVVLAATLGLLESSVRLNTGVISKTDAMQRARLGMDMVTQDLRSQVCLDFDDPAVISGTSDSIEFYGDFTEDGKKPKKRKLTFDPTRGTITSSVYEAPATAVLPLKSSDFPTSPTRRQLVLEAVQNQYDAANVKVPFFTYWANHLDPDGVYRPSEKLAVPLSANDVKRVARIDVAFLARPTGANSNKQGVNLSDQVAVRHLDPNVSLDPKCV
jgi:prepilin-type N-terminal cleavage/methylation domain-containing protein